MRVAEQAGPGPAVAPAGGPGRPDPHHAAGLGLAHDELGAVAPRGVRGHGAGVRAVARGGRGRERREVRRGLRRAAGTLRGTQRPDAHCQEQHDGGHRQHQDGAGAPLVTAGAPGAVPRGRAGRHASGPGTALQGGTTSVSGAAGSGMPAGHGSTHAVASPDARSGAAANQPPTTGRVTVTRTQSPSRATPSAASAPPTRSTTRRTSASSCPIA